MLKNAIRCIGAIAFAIAASPALATFHLWVINEIYSNADGSVQFIELATGAGGQQFLTGHTITSSQGSTTTSPFPYAFPAYLPGNIGSVQGPTTQSFTFPSDLPGDTQGRTFLIGTAGFAALGLVTPDYIVPNGFLFATNGSVNFADVDIVSWADLPVDGAMSINRSGVTAVNSPRNFAGVTATIAMGSATVPASGVWWNPAEGGRGFVIEQRGSNLFFGAFLYDSSGRSTWHAASGAMNGNAFSSILTTYGAGQTLTGAYVPPVVTGNAGAISITFTDASHGTLTWLGGTIPIQRFDIVTGGAAMTPPAGTPETGIWWNPAESGRGFALEIQNGTMFLGGFMFDASGNPLWYSSGPKAMTNATTYLGTWDQYGNGQTLTGAYKPATVVNGNVGQVRIDFSDTQNALLTLPNGRRIPITRFVF